MTGLFMCLAWAASAIKYSNCALKRHIFRTIKCCNSVVQVCLPLLEFQCLRITRAKTLLVNCQAFGNIQDMAIFSENSLAPETAVYIGSALKRSMTCVPDTDFAQYIVKWCELHEIYIQSKHSRCHVRSCMLSFKGNLPYCFVCEDPRIKKLSMYPLDFIFLVIKGVKI